MTKILVIDDHPIVAQGCRQLIEDAGLGTSREANSAAEAIRIVHCFNPDVVILDLEIAMQLALNGLDKNKKLLADLSSRELQILILLAKGRSYSEIAARLRV